MKHGFRIFCGVIVVCAMSQPRLNAALTTQVTIIDPEGQFTDLHDSITSHLQAAMAHWGRFIDGSASFETEVLFDSSVATATGASVSSTFVETIGELTVFEQGMAGQIRTGIDPEPEKPDFRIQINPDYLRNELWFDTNPYLRTQPVPIDRTDAVSIFLHEIGHGLAFNGWRNPTTGELHPGNFASPYDLLTEFNGIVSFFTGPQAVALYGGPVPQTVGRFRHLGNDLPFPGQDLTSDLMNGVDFFRGFRYDISDLNLAILEDVGVEMNPDPPVLADATRDGIVDAADLNILALNWQKQVTGQEQADFTGDNFVDAADLNLLALTWQFGVSDPQLLESLDSAWKTALASVVVPQPASGLLLGLVCMLKCVRRIRS